MFVLFQLPKNGALRAKSVKAFISRINVKRFKLSILKCIGVYLNSLK